ncbi:MAG: GNAT family N-acetyltransferase [Sphingobium sp.]
MWVKGEYFDDFDAVEAAARGSLDRASQSALFDRLEWFRRIWAHCPPGIRPLVVRAVSEKAQAWLFLARTESGSLTALASWYTLSFRPVFTGNPSEAVKLRLLIAIAARLKARRLGVSRITLRPVPVEDGTAELIARAFSKRGWAASRAPATVNWIANLTDKDFPTYWAERPGQVRSTVQRKGKKGVVSVEILDRFDERAWTAYEEIYAQSWKGDEGSPEFLRAMAESEGAAGTLRMGLAYIEDRAVAAQLWTVENGTAIIHKLAYVEDAAEHSPGSLLSAALFQHVIDGGISTIDYGTGNDRYKADWMDRSRPLEQIDLHNLRTLRGLAGAMRAKLARLVRRGSVD